MPHVTLEYTANLPVSGIKLLSTINTALVASGHFKEADIKSRALRFDEFAIGTEAVARGFVHAKLVILKGRSTEVKRQLSDSVLAAIQAVDTWPTGMDVQLCVEVQELDNETYAKAHFQA